MAPLAIERRIRGATPADHGPLSELGSRAFAGFGAYRAVLTEQLDDGAFAWVAEVRGALVGMAMVARRQRPGFLAPTLAELVAIAVDEPWRRTGLGRSLLAAAEGAASGFGAVEMSLHAAASNRGACSFFGAAGYAPSGRRGRYPSGVVAIELTRRLEPAPPDQPRRASSSSR